MSLLGLQRSQIGLNDHDSSVYLNSSDDAWKGLADKVDKWNKSAKKQMESLVRAWMTENETSLSSEEVRKRAKSIVKLQVTCGRFDPMLLASTLMGLRSGELQHGDSRINKAMDRSGDMIKAMYKLMRTPYRQALKDMISGLQVR